MKCDSLCPHKYGSNSVSNICFRERFNLFVKTRLFLNTSKKYNIRRTLKRKVKKQCRKFQTMRVPLKSGKKKRKWVQFS